MHITYPGNFKISHNSLQKKRQLRQRQLFSQDCASEGGTRREGKEKQRENFARSHLIGVVHPLEEGKSERDRRGTPM